MIREKNKIKVMLSAYGSLTAVSIPLKLHKDSYNFTIIECLVPKTINTRDSSFVKVYATTIDTTGKKVWVSQTYNLPYRKDVVIEGFEYELYSDNFPEEFCTVNGSLELTFAYLTQNDDSETESLLTSGKLNLFIEGNGFNPNGVVISNYDATAIEVNRLGKTKVDKVQGTQDQVLVSDGVGGIKISPLSIKEYENQKEYIDKLDKEQSEALEEHKNNQENPHNVTTEQLGLENVDNTSDMDKPISTAQQAEFDNLQGQINSLSNSKADKTEVTTEINNAIASVIDSAPETLDTLKEVANWVAEHETDADNMVANISKNTNDIASLQTEKVSWSELPEGNLLYDSTGTNEDGSMTQKASTEIFETKNDANTKFATKLNKNVGLENANKILVVGEDGYIIPSPLKLTKTTSEDGVITFNLGFADEENEGGNTSE